MNPLGLVSLQHFNDKNTTTFVTRPLLGWFISLVTELMYINARSSTTRVPHDTTYVYAKRSHTRLRYIIGG